MPETGQTGYTLAEPKGAWASRAVVAPVRDTLTRYRIVKQLSAFFDVTLGPLALLTAILLIAELLLALPSPWSRVVFYGQIATWVVFLVAFVVELSLAPKKRQYLRRNWFLIITLAVPMFRVFRLARSLRLLRTARVTRGLAVTRSFAALNRASRAIQGFLGFSQVAYLGVLTVIVWLAAGGLMYSLERGRDSGLNSVGDALWWTATVITTVGIADEPVTLEGRVVAIILRVFGVAVIGYITARMAAYFLGGSRDEAQREEAAVLESLRQEIAALRDELRQR